MHQSYLKAHTQSNKLDKKCKKSFFIIEKVKNTESAPSRLGFYTPLNTLLSHFVDVEKWF